MKRLPSALFVALLASCGPQPEDELIETTSAEVRTQLGLRYSTHADRRSPRALRGATIDGPVYVFTDAAAVRRSDGRRPYKVQFFLDGTYVNRDDATPYLYDSGAALRASVGNHVLRVKAYYTDSNARGYVADDDHVAFTVRNAPPPFRPDAIVDASGRVLFSAVSPRTSNVARSGQLYVEPSTLHSLGFQWRISGDDNENARVRLDFRKRGEATFRRGLDLLRSNGHATDFERNSSGIARDGRGRPNPRFITDNVFAGSALFLDPNTTYEVILTLTDPNASSSNRDEDGRPIVRRVRLRVDTKSEPRLGNGRRLHVYPPNHSGSRQSPSFTRLSDAYRAANAGDRILLHAGRHRGELRLDKRGTRNAPIAIMGANDGKAIVDGNDKRAFEIVGGRYHWLEGFTIEDATRGVYASQPVVGLTVRRVRFEHRGNQLWLRSARNRDILVVDSTFQGPTRDRNGRRVTWHGGYVAAQSMPGYKAVRMNGQGIDVAYNRVRLFRDGLSTDSGYSPTSSFEDMNASMDFYRNDIGQIGDDNEADGAQHNVRWFENLITDSFGGLSAQPAYGGPVYFIRNFQYNITVSKAFKLHVEPSGVLVYHNTTFVSNALKDGIANFGNHGTWNIDVRNNVFLGLRGKTLDMGTFDGQSGGSIVDYNGYASRGNGTLNVRLYRPSGDYRQVDVLTTFSDLRSRLGWERNRVTVDPSDFVALPLPRGEGVQRSDVGALDARPRSNGAVVDAGQRLRNINDDYVGSAPDIGAFERGRARPRYGPRS